MTIYHPTRHIGCTTVRLQLHWMLIACLLATSAFGQRLKNQESKDYRILGSGGLHKPYFEENRGQFRDGVAYVFRSSSATATISEYGIEFVGGAKLNWKKPSGDRRGGRVRGQNLLEGKTNYLVGADPSKWRSQVPHFSEIMVADAFPGVDLRLYFREGMLEYDLILAPGSSPSVVRFELIGWKRTQLRPDGSVLFESQRLTAVQRPPHAFQRLNGTLRSIKSSFRISADRKYLDLDVAGADLDHPLVVDPVIEMSLLLGGNDFDTIRSVQADARGDLYLCGSTRSNDLPVRSADPFSGPLDFSQNGRIDAFVAKVSSTGDLIILTYLGGGEDEEANSIAVSQDGHIYTAGYTNSANFPARGGFDQTFNGFRSGFGDGFVSRLSPDGSSLLSSTFIGGMGSDTVRGLALGQGSEVMVVGQTDSADFPLTVDLLPRRTPQSFDAYVVQFDPSLTRLQFATAFGGSSEENATAVGLDAVGAIWLCGSTRSNEFTTINALETQRRGLSDGFLVKIGADRRSILTATLLGGSGSDWPQSLAVDSTGSVYVSGVTDSSNFPVLLPVQAALKGDFDAFLIKINSGGTRVMYSTYFGGSATEDNSSVAVNSEGEAVICGSTRSLDLPVLDPSSRKSTNNTGDFEGFMAGVSKAGNQLIFSNYIGGAGDDFLNSVVHQGTHVVAVGGTASPNFPFTKAVKPNRRAPGINAGLFDFDTIMIRLRLDTDVAAQPTIDAIRNAASFEASLAPGTWVSVFGKNFLPDSVAPRGWNTGDFVGNRLPESLEGVSVLFDGRAAAISYVSASQINVQVPDIPVSALTRVDVRSSLGLVSAQVSIRGSAPSLFTLAPSGTSRLVAAVFADGSLVGDPNILPSARAARPGDVILLFGTGFGPTSPLQPAGFAVSPSPLRGRCTVRIGNQPAEVLYAGLVAPGLNQINVRVPNVAPGSYQITASVDTEQSQVGVLLAIGQ
jgi:uncharacterized protein (TIGR03437 family)